MANPQCKNGYTKIANEIVENLARIRISGEEMQILWVIFRKTYGWGKKSDLISLSQFAESTGIKKPNVIRGIKKLLSKKIIDVINIDNAISRYALNKDFEKWEPLSKKITLSKKIKNVIKKDNETLSKKIPTKEKVQKKKEKYIVEQTILYLNQIVGSNFKSTTKETKSHISARLREGFSLDDFKTVIDHKSYEWLTDPKMMQFLRPQTLFGTKFESYLNAANLEAKKTYEPPMPDPLEK